MIKLIYGYIAQTWICQNVSLTQALVSTNPGLSYVVVDEKLATLCLVFFLLD